MSVSISSDLEIEEVECSLDCTYPGFGVVASWCCFKPVCMASALHVRGVLASWARSGLLYFMY
jgi:hypothetical protein